MTITLSRRNFLRASTAVVLAPVLPAVASVASGAARIEAVAAPLMPMWAAGTSDEFNWHPIAANTIEEAYARRFGEAFNPDLGEIEEYVTRVKIWDGRAVESIKAADWIEANMGAMCSRCDCECHACDGAHVVGADVVCEECMEIGDWIEIDEDMAVAQLAGAIADRGETAVRAGYEASGTWDLIPPELWLRALAEASET